MLSCMESSHTSFYWAALLLWWEYKPEFAFQHYSPRSQGEITTRALTRNKKSPRYWDCLNKSRFEVRFSCSCSHLIRHSSDFSPVKVSKWERATDQTPQEKEEMDYWLFKSPWFEEDGIAVQFYQLLNRYIYWTTLLAVSRLRRGLALNWEKTKQSDGKTRLEQSRTETTSTSTVSWKFAAEPLQKSTNILD